MVGLCLRVGFAVLVSVGFAWNEDVRVVVGGDIWLMVVIVDGGVVCGLACVVHGVCVCSACWSVCCVSIFVL